MYNLGMSLTLAQTLRTDESHCIAFVGSGGKSSALFQLARELKPPVIVAATSHLGTWQLAWADKHFVIDSPGDVSEFDKDLRGVVVITGPIEAERTKPVADEVLASLRQFCLGRSIPMLIEADGSRQKPLKGWADHEPPIPEFVEHVVQVVGLSGLGKPLVDEYVHRPEIFSNLSGLKLGEIINAETITNALLNPNGARKNFPRGARITALLNQADTPELQASAQRMTPSLLRGFDSVVISNLKEKTIYAAHERVAGIILAAGESSRFGKPKQLLDWKGESFSRTVATKALAAGLSPVLLVTGANKDEIAETVKDLNIRIVENAVYKEGQSASIRAGVNALLSTEPNVGAGIFLLVDQPQITASVLQALTEKHAEGLYPVVAPMVMDRRANPVLFDRKTFSDLLTLEGDVGGRAVFHKHKVEYLPWHDDRLLLDVDTPEQYQRLLADETL